MLTAHHPKPCRSEQEERLRAKRAQLTAGRHSVRRLILDDWVLQELYVATTVFDHRSRMTMVVRPFETLLPGHFRFVFRVVFFVDTPFLLDSDDRPKARIGIRMAAFASFQNFFWPS